MTSGNLQIQFCGLLWLLTSVCIARASSMARAATKDPETSGFALIIQRSRFAGGLLVIPLDSTVRLTQCFTKDLAQNIIRLQYGRRGKQLVMRAANTVEYKEWTTAIKSSLTDDVMAPRLSQSLDAIKRLVEGYDDVAVQWAQVATETRQFSADIASLQPTPNGARPSCIPTRWPSPQQQRAPLVPFPPAIS
ncbi:hypothetical protein PHYSODRAFT_293434 [Phytophthora sojae]|uniref:PH domain-containing protein n=1 Tax=Phytophthora sojae (strain P6497) TaxID=1094619 RepID=G4YFT3_PHYSP|nr:hypothetical protein PHYSODRAFT_293434 [Phytophthora sojae]EGZ27660.1 hypothetical protein PHYSODRAFT_293434 [Phytophthora sojae]|eukprot:XP_009514935.1 hypothetical protein PHYSODRAFT_293434 [Phytophthora sojae]